MDDLTVIYYTSNTEKPEFEQRILSTLCRTIGDLPLISVSQKPMVGDCNICVGRREVSSQNAYRQLQIGAQAATTRFVCPAEADCLYPPDYFRFRPPRDDTFYLARPLYVLFNQRGKAKCYVRKPRGSESTMVCGRQVLIDRIEEILAPLDYWGPCSANGEGWEYLLARRKVRKDGFEMGAPAVTFKTDQNMHRRTPHDVNSKTREIPYWGKAKDLIRKYCDG